MDVGSVFTELLNQLGSISVQQAQQEINLIVGVDEEIEKLSNSFKIVQAMLNDAEERQCTEAAVKLWLDQLRDLYYMMDDVLDKWNTARIRSEIQKEEERAVTDNNPTALKKWKVPCSFFPSLSRYFPQVDNLSLRREIGHKVENLKQTLDNILKDKETYGFDLTRHSPVEVKRTPTTSFGEDVSDIIGRDNYRDELFSNLLGGGSQEESNPRVISLVGMGGIGKSTLAQLAYNHPEIQAHFQQRIWVCVSDPFDQCKVAKAIIEFIEGQSPNITELQSLLARIRDLIGGKKFFLVLDDVWTEEFTKWEPFKNALNKCGAQGSRILVTTRKNNVSDMMESSYMITLGELSVNDCWLMFSKIAFSNKDLHQRRDLEEIGKQLANKCKGLPLAAKTLGSHMRRKNTKEQWNRVLRNSLWEVEDIEKGLLGPLLLSYNELSLSEKQCFLFCAVFPKDHVINRFDLIIHWMAQGYIHSKGIREMEDIAEEYFQKLAMCSFFQDFEKDKNNGRIESCKMHDIVHDFAQSMTKDVCLTIEGDEEVNINYKRTRQLSLIVKETFPESVYEAKNLRFLKFDCFMSSEIVLLKLFGNLTCLRTLYLEGLYFLELPNEVEKLIHLRLLKLSCGERKELPESICNLCNLQSLDVSECRKLKKLPQGIGKLINLRHLLFGDDIEIQSFPKGIGRLTCLKTLEYFPVGKGEEKCKLGELEHLNHIQGSLVISGLRNVVDFGAIENTLKKKKHLRELVLDFDPVVTMCDYSEVEDEEEEEEEEETEVERRRRMAKKEVSILNALEPPPHLESLRICHYMGTTAHPNWMMSKLTYLKILVLEYCPNLERLPPLGKLPLLEELQIRGLNNVGKVGDEFLGIDIEEEELSESSKNNNNKDIIIFPNLKSLTFTILGNWEEWTEMGGSIEEEEKDDSANAFVTNNTPKIKIMPLLHSLTIEFCPNLKSLPDYLRNTPLQKLEIIICPEIGDYCHNISHTPYIRINRRYELIDGQLQDSIDSREDDEEANIDSNDDLDCISDSDSARNTKIKTKPTQGCPKTLPNRHLRRSVTVLKLESGGSSGNEHKEDDDAA